MRPDSAGPHNLFIVRAPEHGRLEAVRSALDAHRGYDEREVAARAHVLEALERLARPFDEHAGPEHVTASAVIVGKRGTVLHVHKRLGIWLQPGGHLLPDEAPWDAARREGGEETGLHLSHPPGGAVLVHVDVHPAARGHVHLDLRYLLTASGDDEPAPGPGESPMVRWFSWDEAVAVADEALVGALRTARVMTEALPTVSGRGPRARRDPAESRAQ